MEAEATVGQLFEALGQMGFSDDQIQAAIQAGCFTLSEAAEWILQDGGRRHTLQRHTVSNTTSLSAFNPPKQSTTEPDLVLNRPAAEAEPVKSRIKQENEFIIQQAEREAQLARTRRLQHVQERELILKRIAEDRQAQQEKRSSSTSSSITDTHTHREPTNPDNTTVLVIRLPSGESLRACFPSDAPLRDVVHHVTGLHPSLPQFSLLHGFPRRCFSGPDLSHSLQALGLSPKAALVLQIVSEPTSPEHQEAAEVQPPVDPAPVPQIQQNQEEAAEHAGIEGAPEGPPHRWGRGHRLVPVGGDDEGDGGEEDEQMLPNLNAFAQNQHQWPDQGNRLRENDDPVEGAVLPGEAALQRLERLRLPLPQADPPAHHRKLCRIPTLITMATNATVALINAPCKQYVSSLACLTPELAEHVLHHMISERVLNARTLQLFVGCSIGALTLNSYPYTTNTLLQQLGAFTHLTHLSMANSALITDAGLSVVCKLMKLQYLNVSSCSKLTDSCLHHLIPLRYLSVLLLDATKIGDAGMLPFLRSFPPALSHLSLNHTSVTEATLRSLAVCVPQLRVLSITHTRVCSVASLVDLQYLHTLQLDFSQVPAESLQIFSGHPTLSSLSLFRVPATDPPHTLRFLSGLNLTHLSLPGRECVSDAGLWFLSTHTLLCELDLSDHTHITDAGISHISTLTGMRKLVLSNTGVTDAGLSALLPLTHLIDLCLNRTAVTSRGVSKIITHLPYLQVLGLSCTQVGDSVLKSLIHCPELIKLNLSRTRITDRGLKFLYRKNLTQLNLDGTGVTSGGVANLIAASPSLISVRANQTRPLPPEEQSDDD